MSSKRKWDDEASAPSASGGDAAAQAAAIAARIAATMSGVNGALGSGSPSDPTGSALSSERKDQYDGAFSHDIEINDLRNRYLITKGSTQQQISQETGASVTTKGVWLPDKSKAGPNEQPLYIHISAPSQTVLDAAIKKVNEVISQELGPLVEDRSQWAKNRERFGLKDGQDGRERRKWPEEKLPINLDSMRNFNVRAKVVGPGGMFVKYIQSETGTRVQIKGLGSGFYENETGAESPEPMHINIAGPDEAQVARAKELAQDLLDVVRGEYEKARQGMGGMGGYSGYGGHGGQGQGYGMQGGAAAQGAYAGYYVCIDLLCSSRVLTALVIPQGYAGIAGTPATGDAAGQPPLPGATPTAAAGAGATPAAGATAESSDPAAQYEAYRAYWAAYGYDVNDPAFQAWQASQSAGGDAAASAQQPAAPAA
ncbi:hypothetical protein NliqN6_2716 [Naganishia liquefaciens]|uniref:K Homology domain-containing protein n=1 Tax=Naganishia liquefaciens TaxID=104408 RepID=A0A8H3TUB9_9TREE|nr:hypothetical protein NliqN6_2716 [Naganishia liquefaciens]